MSKLPGVVAVPEIVIDEPVVEEGVNGPVTVHLYGAVPPVTESGSVKVVPVKIDDVGHVPVILNGTTTVIEQVKVAGVPPPAGSVKVTVKLYVPGPGAVP
jgi:hypothetical protein